ncbi:glycoside hydrolase family 2 [Kiritimatiella glycovorans]|uniref:Beta-mannosidase n=1 Tax=Kiritimatiella glycovorans TaxID=1307763 RepID=A0A0G3EFV9_9BACT|nr:glycoside hydrolase family 2 [Kiritimatiella glycovorans]AKJ63700.1 Glycoside hydrolase, family 2 [Kiritimatiella glycovorans]
MKHVNDLDGVWGLTWTEGGRPAKDAQWIDAAVPGDVNVSLSEAGLLPQDLFYRTNLREAKWVEDKYWWYRTEFELEAAPGPFAELVFDGLDLFATVFVNGTEVGRAVNAFRAFRFDVREALKVGTNVLEVCFEPTRGKVQQLHEEFPEYWSLFTPGRSLVRHAQCQFGWDWAPDALALGIWRGVRLECSDGRTIEDVRIEADDEGDCCVRVEVRHLRPDSEEEAPRGVPVAAQTDYFPQGVLEAELRDGDEVVARERIEVSGVNNFLCFKVDDPKLWWPNGMGDPNCYTCVVRFLDADGKEEQDRVERTFGFRSVSIEEKVLEKDRQSFTFRVNGHRVFLKGANWVPAHCFPGVTRPDDYARLVARAEEAHFNTIRIWGGGIYEKDAFYDECDRRGIMVWQDFANACAEAPDDHQGFLDNIVAEAEYQVRRLRNHPSVVCWCGGNESSNAHNYEPDRPGRRLMSYYYRGIVGDLSPATPYISASPHSKSDRGQVQTTGETHWSTWPRSSDVTFESFRERLKDIRTVFNGEICLQGPSPMDSQLRFLAPEDLWPPNDVVDYHVMYHPANPETYPRYVTAQVRMAEGIIGPCIDADSFTRKAMMAHAEMVREELGFYRAVKWAGSGALRWMFNECWPTSNWADVDFYGALKPSYFMCKTMFDPLAITIKRVHDELTVHLLNDTLEDAAGEIELSCRDLNGKVHWTESVDGYSPANCSIQVASIPPGRVKGPDRFLHARWKTDGGERTAIFFPTIFRDVPFEEPEFAWTSDEPERDGDGWLTRVTIEAKNYCRFVYVHLPVEELREAAIEDNYFDLMAGEKRTVTVRSGDKLKSLDVRALGRTGDQFPAQGPE